MARRKKRRRRPKQKLPLLTLAGLGAGVSSLMEAGSLQNALGKAVRIYTGYDTYNKQFRLENLQEGALPLAVGALGSMIASKTGINRRLHLPFVKL